MLTQATNYKDIQLPDFYMIWESVITYIVSKDLLRCITIIQSTDWTYITPKFTDGYDNGYKASNYENASKTVHNDVAAILTTKSKIAKKII